MASSSIPQDICEKPISVPQSLLLKNEDLACYLVFKIFTHKQQLRVQALRESLAAAWNCRRLPPRVSEYHGDDDVFLAKFDKKSDIDRIVEGAPWVLDGDLVSVQRCRPRTLPSAYPFHVSPFWVQLHGLPIDFLTADVAVLLGNHLGSAVSPSPEEVKNWSSFIRVRIDIDVSKPLAGSLPVALSSNEETIMVQIKYENLPDYCRFCGMIGHDSEADHCQSLKDLEAAINVENLPDDESNALLRSRLSKPKFQHSLRALPFCFPHPGPIPAKKMNTAEITEITEETGEVVCKRNSQEDMQASTQANQVTRHEGGETSSESFNLEEVHGAQVHSSFRKMLPYLRPSVDDAARKQSEAVVMIQFTVRLAMEDPKNRSKALKTAVGFPGVSSATIRESLLVMMVVNADEVAITRALKRRLGYAEIVSIGPAPVSNPMNMAIDEAPVERQQFFVDLRQYADITRWQPDDHGNGRKTTRKQWRLGNLCFFTSPFLLLGNTLQSASWN